MKLRIKIKGFTIVELTMVVAVIGILATIGIVSYADVQARSRNDSRSSKLYMVAEALEKYYNKNGEYPSCASIASPVTTDTVVTEVLKGLDPDALRAPSAAKGTNSITCSDPTSDTFGYIVSGGGAEFTLKYKEEGTSNLPSRDSRHRASSGIYTLTLLAGTGGTVNSGGSYASGQTPTITATPAQYYQFSSWTGSTGCSGTASHTIVMNANKTCTANFIPIPITPPSAPVVAVNTVGSTTTWSWGASSCGTNSARYQYRYTISPSGYDSGWVNTASTSVAFTTSTDGQTYRVTVQAECYNAVTSSGWSDPDDYEDYYRPVPYCTLSVSAGSNGSVNTSGGSYDCGTTPDTPTITATANTYYRFVNWSGTGTCNDPIINVNNPLTVTMTGNTTCTANFEATPINPPSAPAVVANTVGSTTTWVWSAASCGANTARYQYKYTISPSGYDSGWVATSSTSVAFTTSTQGQTYKVEVQAQCYNAAASSGWSSTGMATYYRPNIYTLSLTCTNGTCSGGGSYTEGSVVTMSTTPSATFYFNYWAGSSGCSGSASHSITMDGNKTCTATISHWINGVSGLEGKYVYYRDGTLLRRWKVNTNADNNTWSILGVDYNHPTKRALRDPTTPPGDALDWETWYPAQNNCKNTGGGGRLPTSTELYHMLENRGTYNDDYPFGELGDDYYWTSLEATNYDTTAAVLRHRTTNAYQETLKTNQHAYRCVRDSL